MAKKVIGIIGNIGSGKTTLGNFIVSEKGKAILSEYIQNHDIRYFHERVDEAAKELFYEDRRSFTDELELIQARLRALRHTLAQKHHGLVLFDRTLIEGSETFKKNSFYDGFLTFKANSEYDEIIRNTIDRLGRDPERSVTWLESMIVYLRVKDERILQERQIRRGDQMEKVIPIEYLENLNKVYNKFIEAIQEIYGKWGLKPPKILILDGSLDMNSDSKCLENHTRKIAEEIKKEL